MQRLYAVVLAVACVVIYSWLCTRMNDPASGFARGAGPGCAPSGDSSYEDTA
jgi:hypothetical protein